MVKKLFIFIISSLCFAFGLKAQTDNGIGRICLNPYIPESEGLGEQSYSMLISKLQQIATIGGMSGAGFDNRFIITAHIQKIKSSQTETIPQKNTVHLNIGIYVGDGLDGILFSSYIFENKGVGNSEDQAMAYAIKNINAAQPQLQEAIALGKQRILDYYNKIADGIINTASASASAGNYDEAINMLFSIPMTNGKYETAQVLIAQYASKSLENKNMTLIRKAYSAWNTNQTEQGAADASEILEDVQAPSTKIQSEVTKLQKEITSRLKTESDREYQLRTKEQQNAHDKQMAAIKAAASVAKTYAASRPKVIYRHMWW